MSVFSRASKLVDDRIRAKGEQVSPEERNKRVQAAEYHLRKGVPESEIDTRSRLMVVSFPIPRRQPAQE